MTHREALKDLETRRDAASKTAQELDKQARDTKPYAAAEAGAELLDGYMPGWHRRINLTTLNLASHDYCILGQLHAGGMSGCPSRYANGVSALKDAGLLGARPVPDGVVYYGFAPDPAASAIERVHSGPLYSAWQAEIQRRLDADPKEVTLPAATLRLLARMAAEAGPYGDDERAALATARALTEEETR